MSIHNTMSNQGTGAGGATTNTNGLKYEDVTDVSTEYNIIRETALFKEIQFNSSDKKFISGRKAALFKYMAENGKMDTSIQVAHGCKQPDQWFINEPDKQLFIIETKFQQKPGSVCEKIQTPHFKVWQYNRRFPSYDIVYIYCLSDWFKDNCKAELEYLEHEHIPVFWGCSDDYKSKLVEFMSNYK